MNLDFLRGELERAEEAELQCEEQLRALPALIAQARAPNAKIGGNDCARIVAATMDLAKELRSRTKSLRAELQRLEGRP